MYFLFSSSLRGTKQSQHKALLGNCFVPRNDGLFETSLLTIEIFSIYQQYFKK